MFDAFHSKKYIKNNIKIDFNLAIDKLHNKLNLVQIRSISLQVKFMTIYTYIYIYIYIYYI